MPQKCETRAVEARVSRNSCDGCFCEFCSPRLGQLQAILTLSAHDIGNPDHASFAGGGPLRDGRY